MKSVTFVLLATFAVAALALGACGRSSTEQPAETIVEPEPIVLEEYNGESSTRHYKNGLLIFDITTFSEFSWPDFGVAQKLPIPVWSSSVTGQLITNSSVGFSGYISGVDREAYESYIAACYDAGFNIDYIQTLNEYSAFNADGDWLVFCYYDMQETFYISLIKGVN